MSSYAIICTRRHRRKEGMENREIRFAVRFTKDEHRKAKELAKLNKMPLAEYIRLLLEKEEKKQNIK